MRTTLSICAAVCLYFCTCSTASAQPYNSAIGARLGVPLAVSYKTFISESSALEGYVAFRGFSGYSWISVNGAYQIHNDISSVDGLQWYYGAGAGILFFNFDNTFFGDSSSTTSFSIAGYLGLEYTFDSAPISITADWVPTFFVNGFGNGFGGGYGALGVRYVLGR